MTNPSKLEQVARAMQAAEKDPIMWDESTAGEHAYWLNIARAAIAAMEVPTEEMVDAGQQALTGYIATLSDVERAAARRKVGGYRVPAKIKMAVRFSAMCRAALNEGGR